MGISGKTAVITGGARGIGKAIALRYAREGVNVAVVDMDGKGAEETAKEAAQLGVMTLAVTADVSEEDEVLRAASEIEEKFGGIDILVNNAGLFETMPLREVTVEHWERVMKYNLRTTFLCIKVIGEMMAKRGSGRIINISSTAAERGRVNQVAYCAAKGGVETLTMSAAIQLGPHGVNVNAIAPGIIETENAEYIFEDQELMDYTVDRLPLVRWGGAEDVTGAAVFLAGDDAAYITAATITVDGGLLSRITSCGEDR